jgi:hypothetical protein
LARVLRFIAIEGVQEGAEKSLSGQGIDGVMATFGTDLSLTSDLVIWQHSRIHSGAIGVFYSLCRANANGLWVSIVGEPAGEGRG